MLDKLANRRTYWIYKAVNRQTVYWQVVNSSVASDKSSFPTTKDRLMQMYAQAWQLNSVGVGSGATVGGMYSA